MAQKAMEIELYRQVCFHSQQCAEKGLKAVILEKGKKLTKVHDLLELSKDIEDLSLQLPVSILGKSWRGENEPIEHYRSPITHHGLSQSVHHNPQLERA